MTFDQYNNCAYRCLYCFSQFRRAIGHGKEHYLSGDVSMVNKEKVKRLFLGRIPPPKGADMSTSGIWQFNEYIRQRKAIQWGGLSDPFCPYEKKYGVGLGLLYFFRDIKYQVSFSTKGVWWSTDNRYLNAFRDNPNFHIKVSIITGDEKKSQAIEKGVPSVKERLKMIERLAKVMPGDGAVTLRFRPFIIGISNPGHEQLIRDAANAGASSVTTEFFCLDTRVGPMVKKRYKAISEIAGYDIHAFYKRYSTMLGYLRLNRTIKRRYMEEMQAATHDAGMKFYVSDAHFKESSDGSCCCGLPESWNYSRGQLLHAALLAKKDGTVRFSQISDDLDYADTFGHRNAIGFNTRSEEHRAKFVGHSMKEFLRWN